MTKDKALDLALEALERMKGYGNVFLHRRDERNPHEQVCEAITAIKQARALDKKAENARELGLDYEPPCKTGSQCTSKCQQCVVQEPDYKALWQQMCERCDELDKELSATDRQVEILSDALAESRQEVAAIKQARSAPVQSCYCPNCEAMGKELAALKAQPAPVQEPQRYSPDGEGGMEVDSLGAYVKLQDVTTPPAAQRQWVGLTIEERLDCWDTMPEIAICKTEAKLKEKGQP
jgi:hypothetical protein